MIVARWTGIPVTKLVEGEREKLLRLHETLQERVIGQDDAVQLVTEAVWRARAGIKDPAKPIGSFLILRADRGRENRTCENTCCDIIRLRRSFHPHRHVGVYGEA